MISSTAAMPRLISSSATFCADAAEDRGATRCGARCCGRPLRSCEPGPGCALRSARSGRRSRARIASASAASTRRVVGGKGPSSKVSTTSLSASGNVVGNDFSPTRGVSPTLTVSVRNVPSAVLFGQSAADEAPISSTSATEAASQTPTCLNIFGIDCNKPPELIDVSSQRRINR